MVKIKERQTMKRISVSASELAKAYRDDFTPVAEICERFGVSKPTMYALLDRIGVPRRVQNQADYVATRITLVK